MKALKKFLFRQAERRLRQISPLFRGRARFALHYPGRYAFGIGSYGVPEILDWNEGSTLEIGAFCSIAQNVQIFLGGHHRTDYLSTFPFATLIPEAGKAAPVSFSKGNVVIGSDVWLCTDCKVLSGVRIGHGAVIATGAVVTRDVEPYSMVAGNPARHVRWRHDAEARATLLKLAWWDWPEDDIVAAAPLLSSTDLPGLIDFARSRRPQGVSS